MALDLKLSQLQLDTPVYSNSRELAGHLRLVFADSEEPYTPHSLVIYRGNLGNDVIIPIELVTEYNEGKDGKRLVLGISEDDISLMPEFTATPSRGYGYRDSGYKRSNRSRSNRSRSFNGRRTNSER